MRNLENTQGGVKGTSGIEVDHEVETGCADIDACWTVFFDYIRYAIICHASGAVCVQ